LTKNAEIVAVIRKENKNENEKNIENIFEK